MFASHRDIPTRSALRSTTKRARASRSYPPPIRLVDWSIALYVFLMFATQATRYFDLSTYAAAAAIAIYLPRLVSVARYKLTPEFWLTLALVGLTFVSALLSEHAALTSAVYFAKVLAVAVVIQFRSESPDHLRLFLLAGFAGGLVMAAAGVALGSSSVAKGGDRQLGVAESVNAYGYILNGGVYCSFLLWFVTRRLRPILLGSWFIFLVAIAGAGSRQVLVNIGAMVLCYAILEWVQYARRNRRQLLAAVVLLLGIGVALLQLRDLPLMQRMSGTSAEDDRVALMLHAWELFTRAPWFGVGPGAYKYYGELVYTHTAFMELLATTGVFSFLCYYGAVAVLCVRLVALRRMFKYNPAMRQLLSAMLSVMSATVVAGAFSLSHMSKIYTFLFAAFVGLSARLAWECKHAVATSQNSRESPLLNCGK